MTAEITMRDGATGAREGRTFPVKKYLRRNAAGWRLFTPWPTKVSEGRVGRAGHTQHGRMGMRVLLHSGAVLSRFRNPRADGAAPCAPL